MPQNASVLDFVGLKLALPEGRNKVYSNRSSFGIVFSSFHIPDGGQILTIGL
jgi:hypothetical protein